MPPNHRDPRSEDLGHPIQTCYALSLSALAWLAYPRSVGNGRTWMSRLVSVLSFVTCLAVLLLVAGARADETPRPASEARSVFDVRDYGAISDGQTKNTEAIHAAIAACTAAGGGTVHIPAGQYVTGAIFLQNNVTLHVDAGATILGSEDMSDYPIIDGRWEGIERRHYASLINGDGLENVAITGRGTLDARGRIWWKAYKELEYARGRLIGLYRCTNVLIEGVTLKNSPAWTVHPVYCDNVTMHDLTIINPEDSPNTDGINPDSCRNVRISNCHIDVGDDCIAIKCGKDEDGRRVNRPCENITITNCTMLAGHGGVVIGSEMSGGVRNVVISNCVFDGTDRGIRMKTQRGRGGVVRDVRISNIVMRDVGCALTLNMFYGKVPPEPVSERTPAFYDISISNITVRGGREAGYFAGLPERPLARIRISNAVLYTKKGLRCTDARDIEFHNVRIDTERGPALICKNTENLQISGFTTYEPHENIPVINLEQIKGAFIRGCRAVVGTGTFIKLGGTATKGVVLSGNDLSQAKTPVSLGNNVSPTAVENSE